MPSALFGHTHLTKADFEALKKGIADKIRAHKGLYVLQGIVFIAFGILAAILPGVTALSAELVIGALLLISGIFQLALSQRSRMHGWALLSSILSIIVGGIMLWHPFSGLIALITLIIAFLVVEGIFELMLAFQFHPVRHWGWMLFSGVVALILAAILWAGFPTLGVLYIGWVIALNLMLYGIALLMLVSNL